MNISDSNSLLTINNTIIGNTYFYKQSNHKSFNNNNIIKRYLATLYKKYNINTEDHLIYYDLLYSENEKEEISQFFNKYKYLTLLY